MEETRQSASVIAMNVGEDYGLYLAKVNAQCGHVRQQRWGIATGVEKDHLPPILDQAREAPSCPQARIVGIVVIDNGDSQCLGFHDFLCGLPDCKCGGSNGRLRG
jgi:hypothetical protein